MRRTGRVTGFHNTEQYLDIELIYYLTDTDGTTQRIVQAFPMRFFFRYEIEHLLARAGFRLLDIYGNFDRSPLVSSSPEMIFLATPQ